MLDFKAMGEEVVAKVRDYCAKAVEPLVERMGRFETALANLPTPVNGKDADPEVVRALIKQEVEALPKPKDGEPGKSVDLVALAGEIAVAAAKAVEAMPKPKDGESVDPDIVKQMILDAVDAIPRPADGKSVSIDELGPVIQAEVKRAVDAIEPIKGEPGNDADPEEVARVVAAQIEVAVKALPTPKDGTDGKDADPEVIRSIVDERLVEAIKAIPKPDVVETVHEFAAALIAKFADAEHAS
jgi:hypothetical protein